MEKIFSPKNYSNKYRNMLPANLYIFPQRKRESLGVKQRGKCYSNRTGRKRGIINISTERAG